MELPGRGALRHLTPLHSMRDIVAYVLEEHGGDMHGCYSLLGVSFGALVAWEVARALQDRGRPCVHLVVASQKPPASASPDMSLTLGDEAFMAEIAKRRWIP